MAYRDDYNAKFKIWARNPKVVSCPKPANLPKFKAQRFDSYEAFNAWKDELFDQIAKQGGVKWRK
ncbi:MAG: hypothetical protein ABFR33_01325 [Verrucomicrobiota bacterium]